jgi:hypothetical protein
MASGLSPDEVPVYRDAASRDEAYRRAERRGEPFVGVDEESDGYPLTYDLLPADVRLSASAHERLRDRVADAIESVLADPDSPTESLDAGVGEQMGNVYFFADEASAREVAAVVSEVIFDEDSWVDDEGPGP